MSPIDGALPQGPAQRPRQAQPPATLAGVELFIEATPQTDKAPRTLFDPSWRVTWGNIPAVLKDVAAKLDEWGVTEAKPVVLRNSSGVPQEVIDLLLDYVVLNVKNANLESHIAIDNRDVLPVQALKSIPFVAPVPAEQAEVLEVRKDEGQP